MEIITPTVKLCECGCGLPAPIATRSSPKRGYKVGQVLRFVQGHQGRKSQEDLFWHNVQKGRHFNDCWLWTGTCNNYGYGQFSWQYQLIKAHRFAYELLVGPIVNNLWVLHRCDVRNCVNPTHLFLGTVQENIQDMVQKQRQAKGSQHPLTPLLESDIPTIRNERRGGKSIPTLAREYGVTPTTIWRIIHRLSWKHIA